MYEFYSNNSEANEEGEEAANDEQEEDKGGDDGAAEVRMCYSSSLYNEWSVQKYNNEL